MATMTILANRNGHHQLTVEDLQGLRAEGYIRDSTLDQKDGYGPEMQQRANRGLKAQCCCNFCCKIGVQVKPAIS